MKINDNINIECVLCEGGRGSEFLFFLCALYPDLCGFVADSFFVVLVSDFSTNPFL